MALVILNLAFPGAALFWRKQTLQGIAYLLVFGILNVFRHDIGAMWAVFVWCCAQIHFHRIKKSGSAQGLGYAGKAVIWLLAFSAVVLYSMMYGPSWSHAGEIKYPFLLYVLVVTSLILPAALLTFSLPHRVIHGTSVPDERNP